MTPERLRLRAVLGLGLVLGAFGLLTARLAWLQIAQGPRMQANAAGQHFSREETVPAQRGRILDRNGQILAQTQLFPSVAVDPKAVNDPAAFAACVSRELGVPATDVAAVLEKGLARAREGRSGGRFQWIRRQVADRAAVERLQRRLRDGRIEGLVLVEEPKRTYPLGALGAHVVGFTNRDGRGAEGIEALRDRVLAGTPGRHRTLRDASGMAIASPDEFSVAPIDGEDVWTTLDVSMQSVAEEEANRTWVESGALGVTVAVVDVQTGEIRAVACRPTFDPNEPSRTTADQRRNRFFCDGFEPGSVFKPVVMAAALDAGVVTPQTVIDTEGGALRMKGRTIHEDKGHDYGRITPREILARSSNVAMCRIGLMLGTPRMKSALTLFGFGARTAVRWPGEQAGDVQANRTWRDSDQLVSVAFGHAMTATPAQLLQGYATIAGGGLRRELRLFQDARVTEPVRVVSAGTAAALTPMLQAVLEKGGTAEHAKKNCVEFAVAGKTGTAQKLQTGGHVSSFACYGPSDDPRLAVLVLVDEPRKQTYGSVVAAPYALRVLRQSLHFLGVDPSSAAAPVAAAPRRTALVTSEVAPR